MNPGEILMLLAGFRVCNYTRADRSVVDELEFSTVDGGPEEQGPEEFGKRFSKIIGNPMLKAKWQGPGWYRVITRLKPNYKGDAMTTFVSMDFETAMSFDAPKLNGAKGTAQSRMPEGAAAGTKS